MKAFDFEYDGRSLSDFGFIICNFGSEGLKTISNGSKITFNTVSALNGVKNYLTSTEYKDCLQTTFQICKNPCDTEILEISIEEIRVLSRWLNRKGFHKLKILSTEYLDFYFEASFNISTINMDGKVYGLELNLITNRPFALQEPKNIVINNLKENDKHIIKDFSEEEGYIYPDVEITINKSGDLNIFNEIENRNTFIANCIENEVIKMSYPIIESSIDSHKIQNDFNWNFFRLANSYNKSLNKLTISLPCTIKLVYSPVVKVGI